MSNFNKHLNEVTTYLNNGDYSLGIRRMIDCVMDTQNITIYAKMVDILEKNPTDIDIASSPSTKQLIEDMSKIHLISKDISKPLIEVDAIEKKYAKGTFKISPLSFSVKYGEVVGLVGENGNGKTTLLRLLAKDLIQDSGSISYKAEAETKSLFELRSKLIYIPQRVPRWYGSLMDNLYFTLSSHGICNRENKLKAELIIARLGLRPYKNLGWNRISSGYRTRFELAKALLRQPELMLLDEPLSNLDIISQQTILQDLKHMSTSITQPFGIVLSSQQLYEVEKISDLVVFLRHGVAKYQGKVNTSNAETESSQLIFELETETDRDTLFNAFNGIGLESIQYNGGVYVLHFKSETQSNQIYSTIGSNNLPIRYIRNITHSSRRFFIQ